MKIDYYTGGMLETNAFYLPESGALFDAPDGVAAWLKKGGHKVQDLFMTHGHYDHLWDAAQVRDLTGCRVHYHKADEPLFLEPGIWKKYGFMIDLPPVKADRLLVEGETVESGPYRFKLLHIPGHCPGSICFYEEREKVVMGGDVLFMGGVGRWDLPGGSKEMLLSGIKTKLMTLPDDVRVYPGHGPSTTIGVERATNPYLAGI